MRRRRRNLSQTVLNLVGVLVVVSMIISLALVFIPVPGPTPTPRPTLPLPTATPTATPTTAPTATATPSATATPVAESVATPIPLGGKDETRFTFAVCGDNRGGDEIYKAILRRVEEDGAAFLVNTGDLVQSGRAEQFEAFAALMSDFALPFFPVPGNHDARAGRLEEFLQHSGAPAAHYSFDYGLGHFAVVDSHSSMLFPAELAWLEADLAASTQPLKMVFLHHPPFDPDGTDYMMRGGNEAFMTMMQEYGVSHVFAGHIHAYAEETRDGVHYIITGGAGAPLYRRDHPQAFYHYVRVTLDGTEVSTQVIVIEPAE